MDTKELAPQDSLQMENLSSFELDCEQVDEAKKVNLIRIMLVTKLEPQMSL